MLTREFVRNADFVTSNLEEGLCVRVSEGELFGLGAVLEDFPPHTVHSMPSIVSISLHLTSCTSTTSPCLKKCSLMWDILHSDEWNRVKLLPCLVKNVSCVKMH